MNIQTKYKFKNLVMSKNKHKNLVMENILISLLFLTKKQVFNLLIFLLKNATYKAMVYPRVNLVWIRWRRRSRRVIKTLSLISQVCWKSKKYCQKMWWSEMKDIWRYMVIQGIQYRILEILSMKYLKCVKRQIHMH